MEEERKKQAASGRMEKDCCLHVQMVRCNEVQIS